MVKYSLWVQNYFARGRPEGAGPLTVTLGPHIISEPTRAKLKLNTELDIQYSFRI